MSDPTPSFPERMERFRYEATSTTTQRPATRANIQKRLRNDSDDSPKKALKISSRSPKKQRPSAQYRAPSSYAHLPYLKDVLEPNLICVFVGLNPGISTATAGHAYAHSSNMFWRLLHSSGCTDRRCKPEEDRDLPRLYSMGNTNIVERPSKSQSELSKAEIVAGTASLEEKFLKYKPEAVCIVGKGIWEAIWKYRHGKAMTHSDFHYGWQDEQHNMGIGSEDELDSHGTAWKGSKVFVATSTSGLAAGLKPAEKEAIWLPFGQWVKQRRDERGHPCIGPNSDSDLTVQSGVSQEE